MRPRADARGWVFGGPGEIRTHDIFHAMEGRSQLRHRPALGFSAGQAIAIDSGANHETAVVVSTTGGRGAATITVTAPLSLAHAASAQVCGTGIALTTALTRAHASGAQVAGDVPTPGAPNQYYRRRPSDLIIRCRLSYPATAGPTVVQNGAVSMGAS